MLSKKYNCNQFITIIVIKIIVLFIEMLFYFTRTRFNRNNGSVYYNSLDY